MENKSLGIQHLLCEQLLKKDPEEYRRLLRVPHDVFIQLLDHVHHRIEKQATNMRCPISTKTRLQVTLRYLASGTYRFIMNNC